MLVFRNHHEINQRRADLKREVDITKPEVTVPEEDLSLLIDVECQLKVDTVADGCIFYGPYLGYVRGCFDKCSVEHDFEFAKTRCAASPNCRGLVERLSNMQIGYELRSGNFSLNEEG